MTVSSVDAGPRRVSRTVEVQAPAAEVFALVADPRRHGELDGSGTVGETVEGPGRLTEDARFSVRMKQYGVPYRITSRVTELSEGRVVEWRHPFGHRWRWELTSVSDASTRVTETFDYSAVPSLQAKVFELFKVPAQNATGIEATLHRLQSRYFRR
ncbi:MAG: SRPBCC family protein [Actinomycetota bacterium]|nr:SRPBCC family protein [Actinomycetota bacterium]